MACVLDRPACAQGLAGRLGSLTDLVRRCALLAACWLAWHAAAARAEGPLAHRAHRKAAIASLPMDKLSPEGREKVDHVLSKVTMYRRMPTQVICCDPALFVYMTTHPEILANVWILLGIDDVVLTPKSPGVFTASDDAGTTGSVEYLYQDHETYVLHAQGTYDGPLFQKPVTGSCVLVLKSNGVRETNGRYYVACQLDAFLRLDHVGAEFWTKTLQPLVGQVADNSFVQTASFVESLSRACSRNPGGMCRLAERLVHIDPQTRAEFVHVTAEVADRLMLESAQHAQQAQALAPLPHEQPVERTAQAAPAGPPSVTRPKTMARGQNR